MGIGIPATSLPSASQMKPPSPSGRLFRAFGRQLVNIWKCRGDYARIAPTLILFTVFIFGPALWTVYVSFYDWKLRGVSEFIGLTNYGKLLADGVFWMAFQNTLVFTAAITILSMVLGFLAALLVNQVSGPAKYFARSAIFLPTILSLIVTALIWRSLLEVDGLVERSFNLVGIQTGHWLAEPQLAFASIVIVAVWQRMGYNMVFFLAGLQAIPEMYYEAAAVDGASEWDQFFTVTIPLLQRTTLFILVMNTITTFLMFDLVFAMTGGGPMQGTITLMVYIYNQAFRYIRYGIAGAMAVVFSLIAIAIAMVQMYMLRQEPE